MRAVVVHGPFSSDTLLDIVTMVLPIPRPRDALLKMLVRGVCRTDPHIAEGELYSVLSPLIPGHKTGAAGVQADGSVR